MLYLIDVVGTCNLRCPSCPVGNMSSSFIDAPRPKGFMDIEYFKAIIDKISNECEELGEDFKVSLYNWGEALIHPKINQIVEYLNDKNIRFDISSNFNIESDLWPLVKAMPDMLRVSLSGGFNTTYKKSHVKGDINLVISNLYRLRYLIDKAKRLNKNHKIYTQVYYHLYKDNCGDDIAKIHDICLDLEFDFVPGVAYFMPLEKVIYGLIPGENFSNDDKTTLDRMYISIEESRLIAKLSKSPTCLLLEQQVVINHDGSVSQCCATYDPAFRVADNYLNVKLVDLQAIRKTSQICNICMENGLHNAVLQHPIEIWNKVVRETQMSIGTKFLTNLISKPHVEKNPNYIHPT